MIFAFDWIKFNFEDELFDLYFTKKPLPMQWYCLSNGLWVTEWIFLAPSAAPLLRVVTRKTSLSSEQRNPGRHIPRRQGQRQDHAWLSVLDPCWWRAVIPPPWPSQAASLRWPREGGSLRGNILPLLSSLTKQLGATGQEVSFGTQQGGEG